MYSQRKCSFGWWRKSIKALSEMLHFNIICSGTLVKWLSSQKRSHSRAVLLFCASKLMLLIFQTPFALSAVNCLLILANQKAFPTFPTPQNDPWQGNLWPANARWFLSWWLDAVVKVWLMANKQWKRLTLIMAVADLKRLFWTALSAAVKRWIRF